MSLDQNPRILNALDSSISQLVPAHPSDDDQTSQERDDGCWEPVRSILENPASPSVSSDVNHASDLIKRKLVQTNRACALRFANLYSRSRCLC